MFDPKSDYALNKMDPEAIVYPSATGVHIRLTRENFASEEEFRFWKDFSDGDYKDTERAGRGYYDNCIPLNDALDSIGLSIEDILLAPLLKVEETNLRVSRIQRIKAALTEKQYRRLRLYYLEGKTEAQIAELEGVGQQRISNSIVAGKKAVEKILIKF